MKTLYVVSVRIKGLHTTQACVFNSRGIAKKFCEYLDNKHGVLVQWEIRKAIYVSEVDTKKVG